MLHGRRINPLAIDLSHAARRSVTSLFSNLVTRPTGQAIRTGVESQIVEMEEERGLCLSILDFGQVRVLDYSCADEIVAKLLLRFQGDQRPAEAYFVVRGLHEHHREPIEAVLERHELLLVAQDEEDAFHLLGTSDPLQRAVWDSLLRRGRAAISEVAGDTGLAPEAVAATVDALCTRRVAVCHSDATLSPLPFLLQS